MSFKNSKLFCKIGTGILSVFMLLSFSSCSQTAKELPVNIEEVHITIPGMEGEVKLAYLSDLHIVTMSDEIIESYRENVKGRLSSMSYEGVSAADQLPGWIDTLNASGADYILFGGDMVDFPSRSNIEHLKSGFENLSIPYMYVRADHDISPFYMDGTPAHTCTEYQETISELSDVYIQEFPDFCLVGWNNSTSLLTVPGLEIIREAKDLGKPMILLTHVPIAPKNDDSLAIESEKIFNDRSLIWGFYTGYYYYPNDTPEGEATAELLNMLYSDDSPFVEVLCGHLHFSWDGYISEHVHQHVFSAAFNRYMGMITVSGS